MRDIDIALLRTFLTVVETGGMTPAAQVLNMTQGAVSQQIKRLEGLFGVTLFERRHKRLVLTAVGERLHARAAKLVSLNDETWHLMTQPGFTGEVRLGVPPDIIRPLMPAILRRFSRECPQVQITLVSEGTPCLLKALHNRELDVILTTEFEAAAPGDTLLTDPLVWIGAPRGEAAFQRPLPVSLGSGACAFRGQAVAALNRARMDWLAVCDVGNLESILATVEADMAVATYMNAFIPQGLERVPDEAGLPPLPMCHVNLRVPESGASPLAEALAQTIRQGFAANQYRVASGQS
ncbi:MAG: LysR family transcriptional regulator [Calditrichaeota bacterium]|nr:MAG: LysR family transcriptional regulator [Calditrichota bacterium]